MSKQKRELYQQWIEKADLPPHMVPGKKVAKDKIPHVDKQQSRLDIQSILIGIFLVILCVGLILFFVYVY